MKRPLKKIFSSSGTVLMASLLAAFAVGCTSTDHSGSPTTTPSPATAGPIAASASHSHAECLVCKANADLACVDVPIDDKTPTAEYQGKTYYFCSDECRTAFLKHPEKYTK